MAKPLSDAPSDLNQIAHQESNIYFPSFTADTAYSLGTYLYDRLRALSSKPCVISISHANSSQLLFHACTHPGTSPDNDIWVARKRATVLRWGCSSWYMGVKFDGNEAKFAEKYGLGNRAGEYAIHGGGVPLRVKDVDGVVAVVVVSGLKQQEDHAVVIEGMEQLVQTIVKRKEGS